MQKIAIIGAGVSGMSAAHFLKDRYNVTVFEKEKTPGGLIKCCRINGSLFHTCGGHVFNSKHSDVLDWFWTKFDRNKEFSKQIVIQPFLWRRGTKFLIQLKTTYIF